MKPPFKAGKWKAELDAGGDKWLFTFCGLPVFISAVRPGVADLNSLTVKVMTYKPPEGTRSNKELVKLFRERKK